MASLENRNGSYRVVFRFAGRRYSRSLDTTRLTEARAALARLEDNLRRLALGLCSLPDGADLPLFLLSDGRLVAKPSPAAIQTLRELIECYFASIPEGNLESSTLYGMHIHAKHLQRMLGTNTLVTSLTAVHIQEYIRTRGSQVTYSGRPISPATVKKEIVTLRTIWNWALTMGHIERAFPGRGLKFPKLESKPPFRTVAEIAARIERPGFSQEDKDRLWESAYLTLPEIEELLLHVRGTSTEPYLYPMFVFAAHTGARRSEMIRAEIDDVDLRSRIVLIRERKRIRGLKSTRTVPLSDRLHEVLMDWLARHPGGRTTFVTSERSHGGNSECDVASLTPNIAHKHFKRVLSRSRFAKLRGWHVLRHSFCSNCAARSVDQRVINAWVGHQSEEMVRRYRHLLPTQSRESIELVFG